METIKKLVKEIDQQSKELERMSEDLHKPFAGAFDERQANYEHDARMGMI